MSTQELCTNEFGELIASHTNVSTTPYCYANITREQSDQIWANIKECDNGVEFEIPKFTEDVEPYSSPEVDNTPRNQKVVLKECLLALAPSVLTTAQLAYINSKPDDHKYTYDSVNNNIDCTLCKDCGDCVDCHKCTNCYSCASCTNCKQCTLCERCKDCIYCDSFSDRAQCGDYAKRFGVGVKPLGLRRFG